MAGSVFLCRSLFLHSVRHRVIFSVELSYGVVKINLVHEF
jgi:hypothetical protein